MLVCVLIFVLTPAIKKFIYLNKQSNSNLKKKKKFVSIFSPQNNCLCVLRRCIPKLVCSGSKRRTCEVFSRTF